MMAARQSLGNHGYKSMTKWYNMQGKGLCKRLRHVTKSMECSGGRSPLIAKGSLELFRDHPERWSMIQDKFKSI